jgi:hypothetical protein
VNRCRYSSALLAFAAVAFVAILPVLGCTTADDPQPLVASAGVVTARCAAPLRIAVMLDKTRSAPASVVVQPAVGDFMPLIDRLRECGGELAVGTIRDRTTAPMIRLRLAARELAPPCQQNDRSGLNPMVRVMRDEDCDREVRAYRVRVTSDDAAAAGRIDVFLRQVRHVLDEPPRAARTDLWTAIAQANTFLADPAQPTPMTLLVLVSDGVHTVNTPAVAPTANAIYIVNELGRTGHLGARAQRASSLHAVCAALPQLSR